MNTSVIVWIVKIIVVVALLAAAGALCTPRDRLPLALRGLMKTLHRTNPSAAGKPVSGGRKFLAFLLVIAALFVTAVPFP